MALTYKAAGVDAKGVESNLQELGKWITGTFAFNPAKPLLPLGYFANVLSLSPDLGLAISTDGVGTKILVAQQMDKYDSIGVDCVAMNANDVVCVGARPISMVDYIAVERLDSRLLGQIAKGLCEGARAAGINIPGGEIAQVREMIRGIAGSYGFDLVGTCVGTVHPEHMIIGQHVRAGDVVVGIAASGLHSNGFTLARRALFDRGKLRVGDALPELGRTVGEELLEPTPLYVRAVLAMLDAGLAVKALIHITGDGLLNLARVAAPVGFVLDHLPDPPPIFSVIQNLARTDAAEMFAVFNMGVGFCVVVAPEDAPRVHDIADVHGHRAATVGYAVADDRRRIWIPQHGIVGHAKRFQPSREGAPANPAP